MGQQRFCDKCGRMDSTGRPVGVKRYSLRRETMSEMREGVRIDRRQSGMGGIDLCDECWGNIAQPRMNERKRHARKAAEPG